MLSFCVLLSFRTSSSLATLCASRACRNWNQFRCETVFKFEPVFELRHGKELIVFWGWMSNRNNCITKMNPFVIDFYIYLEEHSLMALMALLTSNFCNDCICISRGIRLLHIEGDTTRENPVPSIGVYLPFDFCYFPFYLPVNFTPKMTKSDSFY